MSCKYITINVPYKMTIKEILDEITMVELSLYARLRLTPLVHGTRGKMSLLSNVRTKILTDGILPTQGHYAIVGDIKIVNIVTGEEYKTEIIKITFSDDGYDVIVPTWLDPRFINLENKISVLDKKILEILKNNHQISPIEGLNMTLPPRYNIAVPNGFISGVVPCNMTNNKQSEV